MILLWRHRAEMGKMLKQGIWVLLMAVLLLGAPRLAGRFASLFDYSSVDPDGAFGWITIHHIFQALFFLIIMIVITKMFAIKFGFGWGDKRAGLFYVGLLAMISATYIIVALFIIFFVGSFQVFPYPLTLRNMVGQLGFQLFLSGPSEELIFRGFSITMLALLLKGAVFHKKISAANIIACVLFGLAHVRFSFFPFSLSYNAFQVFYSMGIGLLYGLCYEQSESMIYPMIMHSMSNVVAVGLSIIAGFVIG